MGLCDESNNDQSKLESIVSFISDEIRNNSYLNDITQNGTQEEAFELAGFVRGDDGVYHARQDTLQQYGG